MLAELRKLKRSRAAGIDNLPPGMLKDASPILAKPFTYIINLSLSSGSFPSDWKQAKVIPIHKSGSKKDLDNYLYQSLSYRQLQKSLKGWSIVN